MTAIFVVWWMTAPFWAVIVVGINSGAATAFLALTVTLPRVAVDAARDALCHRHGPGVGAEVAPGDVRRERGVRALGQRQVEARDRRVGDRFEMGERDPFLDLGVPGEVEAYSFALEYEHEVGERLPAVTDEDRRTTERASRGSGCARSRCPRTTLPGNPRGCSRTAPPCTLSAASSGARATTTGSCTSTFAMLLSPAPLVLWGPSLLARCTWKLAPFALMVFPACRSAERGFEREVRAFPDLEARRQTRLLVSVEMTAR